MKNKEKPGSRGAKGNPSGAGGQKPGTGFEKFYREKPPRPEKEAEPKEKRGGSRNPGKAPQVPPVSREEPARGRKGKKAGRKALSPPPPPLVLPPPTDGPIRINRYIALAGVSSRREAEKLITSGKIKVNGETITDLGRKVTPGVDKVQFGGKELKLRNFVYILLNKPKNHITTVKDDQGRRTVMDIIGKMTHERVFPVGRLDRNTTGLLLFTNDGELAKRLTHPSFEVKKLYHLKLDRECLPEDLDKLLQGFELEDGFIKADKASYIENRPFNEIGVELHSGRNRIVRRMLEHLKYEVESLDRVAFGPLTKKLLPRGKCRFLTEKEIGFLKMM